jgi:hypothetical protein
MTGQKDHEKHAPDEFTEDLRRDSRGLPPEVPPDEVVVTEPYLADPEAHHQHSRKGQAESPAELTPNQPEKKHHHEG